MQIDAYLLDHKRGPETKPPADGQIFEKLIVCTAFEINKVSSAPGLTRLVQTDLKVEQNISRLNFLSWLGESKKENAQKHTKQKPSKIQKTTE